MIDPTWNDHAEYLYSGVVFQTAAVRRLLEDTGFQPGILINPTLMRRRSARQICLRP